MTKFEIYDPAKQRDSLIVKMELLNDGSGVLIKAVDENGDDMKGGNLLVLTAAGIKRPYDVDAGLGIARDRTNMQVAIVN